jgi:Prokaryotic homologs of the JAB domain
MNELVTKRLERKEAQLRAKIEAARLRGGQAALARLQAEFRNGGFTTTRFGPAPMVVDGRRSASRPRPLSRYHRSYEWALGSATKPRRQVELRSERSGFRLTLESRARKAIEEEIQHIRKTLGECEAAGYLYSNYVSRAADDSLTVFAASHAGQSRHTPSSVQLADPFDVRNDYPDDWAIYKQCGDWHSHPSGSTTPSDHDTRAWASMCDSLSRDRYIGLIVTKSTGGSGWMIPQYTAWETRREREGLFACLPCHVEVF